MSDAAQLAKTARESLSSALNALQTNAHVPDELMEIAEPIAEAMSILHRIERSNGAVTDGRDLVLQHVRGALDKLQKLNVHHPALEIVMEAVAESLSKVHALVKMPASPAAARPAEAPAPVAPRAMPAAPAAPPPPAPVAVAAAPTAVPPRAPMQSAPAVYAQQVAPAVPQQVGTNSRASGPDASAMPQAFGGTMPLQVAELQQASAQAHAVAGAPPYAPAGMPQHGGYGYPQAAPPQTAYAGYAGGVPSPVLAQQMPHHPQAAPQPVAVPHGGKTPHVDVELGTHSGSNFYKGLGGNDVIEHGGIFVATYKIPKIGSAVNLRVLLPGDYEFQANAVVQWTRESGTGSEAEPGFGARFTQITAEGRQLVYRYTRNREPLFYDDL
jgi:hypothetical protein